MRPIEVLKYLESELQKIDTEIWFCGIYSCKVGIHLDIRREVDRKDQLHSILQPPMLEDKVRDILESIKTPEISFVTKYYPEPLKLTTKKRGEGTPVYEEVIPREGGWTYSNYRVLYRMQVRLTIPPIPAPDWVTKIITDALRKKTWSDNPRHIRGKNESRLFEVGEKLIRKETPDSGEEMYFVTSYSIPGGGGVRVLKVLNAEKRKWRFISLSTAYKAGAWIE